MVESRQKKFLTSFYTLYAAGALLVYALLMVFVFPWWNTDEYIVELNLGIESAERVLLAYSGDKTVALQPKGDDLAGYHWEWEARLPRQPKYELALVFPRGSNGDLVFKSITVSAASGKGESAYLTSATLEDPGLESVRLQGTVEGQLIYADPGSRLELPVDWPGKGPFKWLADGIKATLGYVLVVLVFLLLLTTFLRFPHGLQAYRKRTRAAEVFLVFILVTLGSVAHLYLVRHSIPVFTPGESDPLVLQAVSFSQGMEVQAEVPGPAYPWFVSVLAPTADWSMSRITLGQGILFCLAVLLVGLSIVRAVQAYLLGPLLLLVLLSPPAIWASRHIGIQSLSASVSLISTAAFLFLWQREGVLRWLGFVVFGLLAMFLAAVGPQGLVLLCLPVGLLAGTWWWAISVRGFEFWKLPVFWNTAAQVAIPLVLVLVFLLLAPCAGDMSGVEATGEGGAPVQARLADTGHIAGWALFLPSMETYSRGLRNADYSVRFGFKSAAQAEGVRRGLSEIMRVTGQPVHVMEKRSDSWLVTYNNTFVPIYSWFYRVLLFVTLGAWLMALSERKYLGAILVVPFLANLLMHVFFLDLTNYRVQSMDAFLWMAALIGFIAINPKAMQKPTDESDRRCMAPIRPKRLLTRFQKVRKMPF